MEKITFAAENWVHDELTAEVDRLNGKIRMWDEEYEVKYAFTLDINPKFNFHNYTVYRNGDKYGYASRFESDKCFIANRASGYEEIYREDVDAYVAICKLIALFG